MEVILLQDIPGLGHKDQIVKVKNGYANNYLIPKRLATLATPSAKKHLEEKLRQQARKKEKLINEANKLREKIESKVFTLKARAGEKGKIFGSITNVQLADILSDNGIKIDRKIIEVEHIKELGNYEAKIRLYKDIFATMKFEVVAENK